MDFAWFRRYRAKLWSHLCSDQLTFLRFQNGGKGGVAGENHAQIITAQTHNRARCTRLRAVAHKTHQLKCALFMLRVRIYVVLYSRVFCAYGGGAADGWLGTVVPQRFAPASRHCALYLYFLKRRAPHWDARQYMHAGLIISRRRRGWRCSCTHTCAHSSWKWQLKVVQNVCFFKIIFVWEQ